jgi:N-acetylglucosamine-6-sulfatase
VAGEDAGRSGDLSMRRSALRAAHCATAVLLALWPCVGNAQREARNRRNVIFILSDDHRHDFMSFVKGAPPFLRTPNLDRMAARGSYVPNAFVTTALCSPSRASILTGRYAHRHGVVDNTSPIPKGTMFFPELLQRAGYRTAYIGKWHMGEDEESDMPRPGFDQWVSFRGQGVYSDPTLNMNGTRRQVRGYTTDILTDQALDWLRGVRRADPDRPFFLYLAHKAVHAEFQAAPRHAGRYADAPIPYPETMANTEDNYRGKPRWVREQRNSWHGVDFAYHGALKFDQFYRSYAETLLAVDEGIGRILDYLDQAGLSASTMVVYTSDNGFVLGEHGLIDKRHAYEKSIRVPMVAYAPGLIAAGDTIAQMVRNIDIAPTILALAGVQSAWEMDGQSVLGALRGDAPASRGELLYEYYWEYAFPQTPTTFALRGDRYKYIFYHGIWDENELYDLVSDPMERYNLIDVPMMQDTVRAMRTRLFDRLQATDGMRVPVRRGEWQAGERKPP